MKQHTYLTGKMIQLVKRLVYFIIIILSYNSLYAQSLDQAKKLYNEGQYADAKPAFERLVKQAPNNASYNLWYGVCCYKTGDLEEAEKYLSVAVKRRVQEAHLHLGEMYMELYRFEEAAEMFEEYADQLAKKKQDVEPYKAQMELAQKAQRMVEKVENIQIIDSMVVDKNSFLSSYTLSEEGGSLSYYKDFFNTEDLNTTVYMNEKGDKIYYARPTGENRYCLFTQSRLLDNWGDEKQLPMNINSKEDDNYPFVLSDGVTIYYASKGNGSIGGYDLFVTRYNTNSDTYLTPEQLGMPFNSFANDYMLVIDEAKGLGWFVSDRFQPEGKVCVYLYIPDALRSRIEGEDMALKRARATITSIKDSWKPGSDYTELIRLAHTDIPSGKEEIKKDFEFIINNTIVYYKLDEIKSPEAKSHYQKVIELNKQINSLDKKLNELRVSYTQGNRARKDQLRPTILQAEEQFFGLLDQPGEWEKKARNAEINFLKLNR
ncbi:TolA-binding protein [Parabacteroides sp. PF5-5]|nr:MULTISPECIES: tetratricopeptide repeat protein [unclassified Parabacteroides]MDH6305859.1 TolA-binding protein [Parabacteroides sp. PH5-39]MDH6317327.1 TolA-binding protein [Parabacteroides sp. PF5-13]MDH6320535.1 TolA-binding protein [Parabacteroides sp. PH5-13]MDH6328499.1 TolA-binding protein [Parabacteroides sp. PH5-41]MDH6336301.1 TolA-binding protein [Parabacteroides sp. PF5-5]